MKKRGDQRGAAAVEFALVAMLLVILLLGIVEFGFVFFRMGSFASAAREGARYYAIHYSTDPEVEKNAKDAAAAAAPGVTSADVDIVEGCPPTFPAAPPYPNAKVIVKAAHSPGFTGFFGWLFQPGYTLKGEGVMRCGG